MTTNPGPEYFIAQEKYEQARTTEQKLAALQEMHKYVPKHKASEKMVAELTAKIARLKKELEKEKEQQSKKASGHSINVKKEGDGQIAILGMPNTGKSHLLHQITGVDVEIAPYPFTTTSPQVGMMAYKGANIQLVEVPAIVEGSSEGKSNGTAHLSIARNADALIILYNDEGEKQVVVAELRNTGILLNRKRPKITIQPSNYKGITISGKQFLKMGEKELEAVLKGRGTFNAGVLLEEETTMEKLEEALDGTLDYKNCLFLQKGAYETDELRQKIFALLGKIIVYTKKPGHEPDYNDPLVLKEGATISDAANFVHKDIAKNIKYAKVWGSSKYDGQRVSKDYALQNGDVIEISA